MGSELVKIKPAARLITAIGEDLIKDVPAAIVELVKNSYDADASTVIIKMSSFLNKTSKKENIKISIFDDGHGMSTEKFLNAWMVPATNDKLLRKYSPSGRPLQGRKGIGRYAASILGNTLYLDTIDLEGKKTAAKISWDTFKKAEYLDQIEIPITIEETNETSGTTLKIYGNNSKLSEWDEHAVRSLIRELRKLLSPIKIYNSSFQIRLVFESFPLEDYQYQDIEI